MKRWIALLLCFLLLGPAAIAEEGIPAGLSYPAQELLLPAAFLRLYVPSEMDSDGGDMEAYELGYRFNCYTETFSLTLWVHDNRDQSFADYTAYYAKKTNASATAETINGFPVQRLVPAEGAGAFTLLVPPPFVDPQDAGATFAVYHLSFSCDGEKDLALANEILSTLQEG